MTTESEIAEFHLRSAWRIEREPVKLFFRVVRTLEDGPEFIRSASGKVSIFRTYAAAQRALRRAERMEGEEKRESAAERALNDFNYVGSRHHY
jgi:hypothetical protein